MTNKWSSPFLLSRALRKSTSKSQAHYKANGNTKRDVVESHTNSRSGGNAYGDTRTHIFAFLAAVFGHDKHTLS
jgi:hypothetical protein